MPCFLLPHGYIFDIIQLIWWVICNIISPRYYKYAYVIFSIFCFDLAHLQSTVLGLWSLPGVYFREPFYCGMLMQNHEFYYLIHCRSPRDTFQKIIFFKNVIVSTKNLKVKTVFYFREYINPDYCGPNDVYIGYFGHILRKHIFWHFFGFKKGTFSLKSTGQNCFLLPQIHQFRFLRPK